MSDQERLALAVLGLHPHRTRELLEHWGSHRAVLRAIRKGQVKVSGSVRSRLDADPVAGLRRSGATAVARTELPEQLRVLPDAPDLLFVRGAPLPPEPGVAIVGTRRATTYGLAVARQFGRAVARAGWPVISGLARGVDGAAHEGCLEGGGQAVAVLGCGVDVCYPPEHGDLLGRLLAAGGSVASEYPAGSPPEAWRFPPRNRIISGLAAAVVVVEAGVKGGALITAARGLEQGRQVMAVPGDIDRATSHGCNLLIRDGAHPVLDAQDLITGLTFLLGPPPAERADRLLRLLEDGPRTIEELAMTTRAAPNELLARLTVLEARCSVQIDGGMISRVRGD